ncbi:rRNA maturation RNase YbeY [Limosilactobacillus mucosae]|jgi:probable rRNA maturation factor|uniref:Endoribonuclease YbeY n=1 Tax=Limosilactobacillus mucosae TaxID=97478 RepID=A0AAJ1MAN9_LIMMU|nr:MULTISPECIES: rRNA maturation RNase YbeY [Lactobacillaceae]MDD6454795.1 rRNA maturation RNase YbeY [Lactobacillus sp.]MDC2829960.1 rRNA maturation RNase YbeY [Limosilactobacillus mucosae]MDC2837417.1 rRNA maturation RNase YbeY [Limosilactobacillus mucosae]MDC2839513.1 rRNA maturation RNase YbeY [Limosilactobacillus mucosae]MDC2840829.1 rRNA maturation RNase YbeY [Limosilactobacillus mucosae]
MDIEIYDQTDDHAVSQSQLQLAHDILDYAAKYLELKDNTEISLTFVHNPQIRKLNAQYRGVDRATDVLSFALEDDSDDSPILLDPELAAQIPENLGDLFISIDKVAEQARFLGHSADRELGFLIVHGFLHLNGYDHEQKDDEEKMFKLQEEILNGYGLPR